MIIRHEYEDPSVDGCVFLLSNLSDKAKILYGFIASRRNGYFLDMTVIGKKLEISNSDLITYKQELEIAGLIFIDQTSTREYVLYIGDTRVRAENVRSEWLFGEDALEFDHSLLDSDGNLKPPSIKLSLVTTE